MQTQQPPQQTGQQAQEIKAIFDEFKDQRTGKLDVSEFTQTLKNTGTAKNCQLLVSKLENKQGQMLDEESFSNLFNFNFVEKENFDLLFNLIDSSGLGTIGKEELKRANNQYRNLQLIILKIKKELQLNERDIDIMINYSGSQEKDKISRDALWNLMSSYNQ